MDGGARRDAAADVAVGSTVPVARWPRIDDEPTLPGLGERVVHPEFAGMQFVHVRARSLLNRVPDPGFLPFSWTINVYRGCSHACGYCFARPSHAWLELDPDRDFERVIVVKVNAVERLRAELRARRWRGEAVALGTNTDPYQRCEGRYRLTRGVVTALAEAGNPFSILTKGTLITRDLDVLGEAAARGVLTSASLSIATLDDDVWRLTEPGAPGPRARLDALAALRDAGVDAGVMLAPIIPGLSDDPQRLRAVIANAVEAGARSVTPIVLHLRPGVREIFLARLQKQRPDLAARLRATYTGAYAPTADRDRVRALVRRIARSCGLDDPPPRPSRTRRSAGAPAPAGHDGQLSLL